METSYTCGINFAVLDSQNLFFVNKVTVKYWDLTEGWPRSLNRGDRLMEVKFTVNKGSNFRDFDR